MWVDCYIQLVLCTRVYWLILLGRPKTVLNAASMNSIRTTIYIAAPFAIIGYSLKLVIHYKYSLGAYRTWRWKNDGSEKICLDLYQQSLRGAYLERQGALINLHYPSQMKDALRIRSKADKVRSVAITLVH
jgi:hypothetical protein